jgi:TonB family protein
MTSLQMTKILQALLVIAMSTGTLMAGNAESQDDAPVPFEQLDRTPRVLSQGLPEYPLDLIKRGIQGTVIISFVIDKEGAVVQPKVVSSPFPELDKPALEAILTWKFQPGRRKGEAVFTNLEVPFYFSANKDLIDPLNHVAQVISQPTPIYPTSLGRSGFHGEVYIKFTVDEHGNVTRPNVIRSSHPDFEAPVVEAILQWKFTPAMKNGQAVSMQMEVPIVFGNYAWSGTLDFEFWNLPPTGSKQLPVEFQYDHPPKPILTSAPVYPFDLLVKGIKGAATVTFAVDAQGKTHVVKMESATLPEFGAAASAMISAWTFEPATKRGRACWAFLSKKQTFNSKDYSTYDQDFAVNDATWRLLRDLKRDPSPVLAGPLELDSQLQGHFQPDPIVPDLLLKTNSGARAVVEFIVDHAGHAQVPRIISTTDDDFGWAAATAVARWQYSPPTKKGRPVDVFVRVPVEFSPALKPSKGS